jgi:hypothetical protein
MITCCADRRRPGPHPSLHFKPFKSVFDADVYSNDDLQTRRPQTETEISDRGRIAREGEPNFLIIYSPCSSRLSVRLFVRTACTCLNCVVCLLTMRARSLRPRPCFGFSRLLSQAAAAAASHRLRKQAAAHGG